MLHTKCLQHTYYERCDWSVSGARRHQRMSLSSDVIRTQCLPWWLRDVSVQSVFVCCDYKYWRVVMMHYLYIMPTCGNTVLAPRQYHSNICTCNNNNNNNNKWSESFNKRPHHRGGFFTGTVVMCHRTVGSIAVGYCSRAVMPLLRTEWCFLLRHRSRATQCFSVAQTTHKITPRERADLDPWFLWPTWISLQTASRSV